MITGRISNDPPETRLPRPPSAPFCFFPAAKYATASFFVP